MNMQSSQNSLNIYQRLNRVMQEVSYIQKGEKRVNNQYRYVAHDQVSSILHEPLTRHGIVILPNVLEMTQDGNRTTARVEVSFVNIDNPTDKVSITYVGYGIDQGDKGPGKAISYACKYAMLKTFCLETGDDPDHDQEVKYEAPKQPDIQPKKSMNKSQLEEITQLIAQCDANFKSDLNFHLQSNEISLSDADEEFYKKLKKSCLKNISMHQHASA